MQLGILYSGEEIEPRSFRALSHFGLMSGVRISQIIDASKHSEDRKRVENAARFFGLPLIDQSVLDFSEVNALIVEIRDEVDAPFKLKTIISESISAGVHLHLPYHALASLQFEDVVHAYKAASEKGIVLLGSTRFLFGQVYNKFRSRIGDMDFGGFQDGLFSVRIGPVINFSNLLSFGLHHLQILFDLFPEKLQGMSILAAGSSKVREPCVTFILRYATGKIATFLLTSNNIWGAPYHRIAISGKGATASTDLATWSVRIGSESDTRISEFNDDDMGSVLYGSAGKLNFFYDAVTGKAETQKDLSNLSLITQKSLYVNKLLTEMLPSGDGIATRMAFDIPPGW